MNFETFFSEYCAKEKAVNDALKALTKYEKLNQKSIASGDVQEGKKAVTKMYEAIQTFNQALNDLSSYIEANDFDSYFTDGDFVSEMLEVCNAKGIDVVGEAPNFEMFPYKVRLDGENKCLFLNRKKFACLRPEFFISMVASNIEKLNKASFNADKFVKELEAGYDIVIKTSKKLEYGKSVELQAIYKALTPMARSRSEYDLNAFSYDIARLYAKKDSVETKSGKKLSFGTAKQGGSYVRILDENGVECLLGTVAFID